MSQTTVDLVGRERELAALGGLVAELAAGQGGLSWVEGEPGIGKSALLDVVASDIAARGVRLLRASGDELLEPFPLRLMADCLGVSSRSTDPALSEVAALLRGGMTVPGTLDPVLAAGERMLELIDRWATSAPLVLIVENLQWADEPSLLLWNRLIRVVDQIPLLLIGSCRPVPRRATVSRLRAAVPERDGLAIDLGPLEPHDLARVCAQVISGAPGPRLSTELARTGGNPLYVRELVNALVMDGLIEASANMVELREGVEATPDSLAAAIGRRLSFLSDETVDVLRMAALLGAEFDVEELKAATGRSALTLAGVLDEAMLAGVLDAGLVTDLDRRVRFRHDLILQALVEQTPVAVRAALHAELARSLAQAGGGLDVVARHLLAVPEALDRWAVQWLADMPASALHAAPHVSAELLGRALPQLPEDHPWWQNLAARLVQVLFWLGRDQQVIEVARRAVPQVGDIAVGARMRIYLARSAGRTHRLEEALAAVNVRLDDDRLPAVWRARLAAWRATCLIYAGRLEEGRVVARQALEVAHRCDDPLTPGYIARLRQLYPDAAEHLASIDEALARLGEDPESLDLRMTLLYVRMCALYDAWRRDDVHTAIRETLVLAERVGAYRLAGALAAAAELCYNYGEWDESLLYLSNIDPEFLATPGMSYLHGRVALIAMHRDEPDRAEEHIRATGFDPRQTPADTSWSAVTAAAATLAESQGDFGRALALRVRWLELPPAQREESIECGEVISLVRLALAVGDTAAARAAIAACQEGVGVQAPDVLLGGRCGQAMLADDVDGLLAAGDDCRRHGIVMGAALAAEEAAVRLAHAGDLASARKAFHHAVRGYHELGASWDIRRADARLRPLGIRRGPRSRHTRATTGWEALTPSETRITRLVAKGMSNPDIAADLFLSRNTVQTHVSNILRKLELRSRVELIRVTTEHLPG